MARRPAGAEARSQFEKIMFDAEVSPEILATRWGKDVRRINQIRVSPRQLHIDAIVGFAARLGGEARLPELEDIWGRDAVTSNLASRWALSRRRINQIRENPQPMHADAMRGVVLQPHIQNKWEQGR